MKEMKILLGVVLLLAIAVTAYAQSEADFEITQNEEGTITITGYTGTAKDVVIPETIEGIRVTYIWGGFNGKGLTSVIIPDSVDRIQGGAFENNRLTNVIIPHGVTRINPEAFANNQLTSIVIPDGVTLIGEDAFANNQLTSVTIPNSVTRIERRAFANNQLTSLDIPDGVTVIQTDAFRNNKLVSVTVPDSVVNILGAFTDNPTINRITIGTNKNHAVYGGFPHNFGAFYQSQDRRAGTYTWSGRLWRVE